MSDARRLALIPCRDTVLYPGAEVPLYVGREATIRAVKYAKANGGDLALFTQLHAEKSGPILRPDIFPVGTLTHIEACVELKDQTMKLMLVGTSRVRLQDLSTVDDVTIVTVTPWPETNPPEDATISAVEQKEILASLAAWRPDLGADGERAELQLIRESKNLGAVVRALRTLVATPNINKFGAEPAWRSPEDPPSPRYRALLNEAVARRQSLLEEQSFKRQLALLQEALSFDISCRSEELGA